MSWSKCCGNEDIFCCCVCCPGGDCNRIGGQTIHNKKLLCSERKGEAAQTLMQWWLVGGSWALGQWWAPGASSHQQPHQWVSGQQVDCPPRSTTLLLRSVRAHHRVGVEGSSACWPKQSPVVHHVQPREAHGETPLQILFCDPMTFNRGATFGAASNRSIGLKF